MKWLWIEAWAAANFWRVFISLNLAIAPSRRRNDWCEFSARSLLLQRAAVMGMMGQGGSLELPVKS